MNVKSITLKCFGAIVAFLFVGLEVLHGSSPDVPKNIMLNWTKSIDSNAIGTKIYMNTVPPTNVVTFDAGTLDTFSISNLSERVTYSFYVVAYDTNHLESEPSNVILFQSVPDYKNKDATVNLKSYSMTNNWNTYLLTSAPTHGTITGTPPAALTYKPYTNYVGPDGFVYMVKESMTAPVTGWVQVIVYDQISYVGTKLEWWTSITNKQSKNFSLMSFTNPPSPQYYRSYLIITNSNLGSSNNNIVSLRSRFEWWTSLTNVNRKYFDLLSFTNPPIPQYYRALLLVTNNPI